MRAGTTYALEVVLLALEERSDSVPSDLLESIDDQ